MAKMGDWKEEIGLVLHPYYALHLISVLFYFLVRFLALPSISASSQHTFVRWEAQAVLSLGLVSVVKFGRRNTLEGFLGDVLLYIKCALALLVAILDPRVLAWYLFAFSAIFLLWYQPTFSGSDNVIDLTPLQLENNLLENHAAWLVEFGAPWSPRCNHFRRIFAGLSLKYSNPALRFGRIDVRCFPKTATKYHIEFGG